MAVTISLYNNVVKRLLNKEVTFTTLKVMLLNNSAAFDATHTTLAGPAGAANVNQVSGNGWTAGGETLASVAVTVVTTNDAMIDAADVVVGATGGAIGPAYKAVIYDDTDVGDAPIAFIDFGGAKTADEGTDFKIQISSSGLITGSYTLP